MVKNGHGLVPLCSVQLQWRYLHSLRTLVTYNLQMCFFFVTSSAGETIYHTQFEKESLQMTISCKKLCHMSQLVPKFLNFAMISKDILLVFKLWLFPSNCSENMNIYLLTTDQLKSLFCFYMHTLTKQINIISINQMTCTIQFQPLLVCLNPPTGIL